MEKEQFYVGIENTKEVRRNVLESSREMVHILQSYEKVQEIRKEKLRRVAQLKTVLEELKLLSSKLQKELPSVQVRDIKEIKETKKPTRKKSVEKKKEKIEIEKLETDLSAIEARLSQL